MFHDKYLNELLDERELVDPSNTAYSYQLLEQEIERVKSSSHDISSSSKLSAGFKEEVIKLSEKIILPVEEYSEFNFVGRILGPRGNTLQGIQTSTHCKISILGRGSTKDRKKEEELSESGDARYEHFKEPLHLLVETEGVKSEAHGNLATALSELQRCLAPDDTLRSPRNYGTEGREMNSPQSSLRFGTSPGGFFGGIPNRNNPILSGSMRGDIYSGSKHNIYQEQRNNLHYDTYAPSSEYPNKRRDYYDDQHSPLVIRYEDKPAFQ